MRIPFFQPSIGDREVQAAIAVLRSGWLTTGTKCREFEEQFAEMLGGNVETVAVNSATAGIHLAAESCGIGPGDAVLVPTLTFSATAAAFHHLGAEVILVDVDRASLTIDLDDAERRWTPQCKAIAPVHFGGWPCDIEAILAFARKRGLKVIEDAAHALPAQRNRQMVGSSDSDACVFSFYANKTITTGEGGMIATRSPLVAARARMMRTHGLNRDAFDRFRTIGASWSYDVVAAGFKYNLTDLAAAIGLAQLERVYEFQSHRQAIAERYLDRLSGLPLDLPALAPQGGMHAWHLFPVRVRPEARMSRDDLIALLTESGIGSSVHYRPLHQMTYWSERLPPKSLGFPVADAYFAGAVTLPLYPGMQDTDAEEVISVIRQALG
ncbi:DegT/DnrJ/EryC1/StrS family aminotransferase [Labrys miyagiensis]|nr:DegT/DnrJ/EryC1/StrS family aminotransferase [Labrys miyagiensis]